MSPTGGAPDSATTSPTVTTRIGVSIAAVERRHDAFGGGAGAGDEHLRQRRGARPAREEGERAAQARGEVGRPGRELPRGCDSARARAAPLPTAASSSAGSAVGLRGVAASGCGGDVDRQQPHELRHAAARDDDLRRVVADADRRDRLVRRGASGAVTRASPKAVEVDGLRAHLDLRRASR